MGILDLIYPKKCLECGIEGVYVCGSCIKKVPPGGWTDLGKFKVYSIWRHKGVVQKAIIALKYKFVTGIADELIGHINLNASKQTMVSIPAHWHKQNLRGFNQAELLGKKLAAKMKWNFLPELLVKSKSTPPQVGLRGSPRRQNLNGVFMVNPKFKVPYSVLLFDDVLTTGSTLTEAAKTLSASGVEKIWGLTIAR